MNMVLVLLAATMAQDTTPAETTADKLKIGGQARFRVEERDALSYSGGEAEEDGFALSRLRLNFAFVADENIDLFVQVQDSHTFGSAGVGPNTASTHIRLAFVDFRNLGEIGIDLQVGRIELKYGDQRMISPLDWSNTARAWDGVKVHIPGDGFWVDVFATVQNDSTVAGATIDHEDHFYGVYFSTEVAEDHTLDIYALHLARTTETPAPPAPRRDLSIGIRLKGKSGSFDYSGEVIVQSGEDDTIVADDDVDAMGFAATFGVKLDPDGKGHIKLEYTMASGDDAPGDGDNETFKPPFPFGHAYQGHADQIGWFNSEVISVKFKYKVSERTVVHVDVHSMSLSETSDAWYSIGGAPIRAASPTAGDDIGQEIDLYFKVNAGKGVKLWFGYSNFSPGDFVDDTGLDPDMDWLFFQMVLGL